MHKGSLGGRGSSTGDDNCPNVLSPMYELVGSLNQSDLLNGNIGKHNIVTAGPLPKMLEVAEEISTITPWADLLTTSLRKST